MLPFPTSPTSSFSSEESPTLSLDPSASPRSFLSFTRSSAVSRTDLVRFVLFQLHPRGPGNLSLSLHRSRHPSSSRTRLDRWRYFPSKGEPSSLSRPSRRRNQNADHPFPPPSFAVLHRLRSRKERRWIRYRCLNDLSQRVRNSSTASRFGSLRRSFFSNPNTNTPIYFTSFPSFSRFVLC